MTHRAFEKGLIGARKTPRVVVPLTGDRKSGILLKNEYRQVRQTMDDRLQTADGAAVALNATRDGIYPGGIV